MRLAPLASSVFGLAALLLPAAAPAQGVEQARATVGALDDGLLAIMRAGRAAGVAGRAARIGPVVDRAFDIPLMTRLAVGPAWTGIAATDQAALVGAFRRLTVQSYARNFDSYAGESFAIQPGADQRGGDVLVRTTLTAKGGPVAISYRLRGGRIIDVFYKNSISQLATRRADFAAVLQRGGAKALVAHLNDLSSQNSGKPAA